MNKEKSTAFLKGTISLSISVIVTKILGVAFKVPLSYVVGDEGMGYFNTAYAIYGFFYILCTAGVPKSLTILLRGRSGESCEYDNRFILKCGLRLFTKIGLFATLLNIVCAPAFAKFIGNTNAVLSIILIAPSILFVSLGGVLRGYLNSYEKLIPIAVSQLLEGASKLALGLLFAFIGVRMSAPIYVVSALAISGITVGSALSFAYMLFVSFFNNKGLNCRQKCTLERKSISAKILKNAIPIALSSSLLNLSSTIDLTVIIKRLVNNGMSEINANSIYGNYTTLAVPMFTLVVSVLTPISTSYMPRLSEFAGTGHMASFKKEFDKLLLITLLISVPASIVFWFYSFDLLDVLFSVQSSALGADMLVCLSCGLSLLTSLTVVNTALESMGKVGIAVGSLTIGAITKFVVSYLLVGNTSLGILGAPVGTVISYAVSLIISLTALEISGVKSRVMLKTLLLYVIGIASFLPMYRLIYYTGVGGLSIISMGLSITASLLMYAIFLLIAYILDKRRIMFKMHKKQFG